MIGITKHRIFFGMFRCLVYVSVTRIKVFKNFHIIFNKYCRIKEIPAFFAAIIDIECLRPCTLLPECDIINR